MDKFITCRPRALPDHKVLAAADLAVERNPANHAPIERLMALRPNFRPTKQDLAVLRTKYWGASGVRLTVGFLDTPETALRRRILFHMNAWSRSANVAFVETRSSADVRIARAPGDGHWSYIGTDIQVIDTDEPTMNLESFTMQTPESEFVRVVRHEAGHTLGFIHEHMRRSLVMRIDAAKAIAFYGATQGWSPEEVRAQVLTPIEESSLRGTSPDPDSIMCYQIDGSLTIDGDPILGGLDLDEQDHALAAKLYPQPPSEAPVASPELPRYAYCGPVVFLTNDDPAYVAAVLAATRAL
jgi:hypothetical protein